MRRSIVLYHILMFISCSFSLFGQKHIPINPKASKEAYQLLEFLYTIQAKHYTLSGQHNFVSDLNLYENAVRKVTGKTPVLWGSDFSFNVKGDSAQNYQHCGPMNLSTPYKPFSFNNRRDSSLRADMIAEAIQQYKQGRIITLMWHACFPTDGDECDGSSIWTGENRIPDEAWEELTTPGTFLHKAWQRQADRIASYLKQLRDLGIPVLWRPYHEMNGSWFWWGGHPGENGYKKLWIMMYDYFTHYHKLNNLLWVWNASAISQWVPSYVDFFPGTEYVDLLATDVYRREYTQETYDELVSLGKGKIVALGEIGEMPTNEQYKDQPYTWFMCWGYYIDQYNSAKDVKAIYDNPRTITLDEIDFSKKTYKLK